MCVSVAASLAGLTGCALGAADKASSENAVTVVSDAGAASTPAPSAPSVSAPFEAGSESDPNAALLASLSVSPLALLPAFSPTIHDYVVRCPTGGSSLNIQASASPGASVALLQPTATPGGSTSMTSTVTMAEGDAAVLGLSQGGTTVEYWIRCLPADFPTITASFYPDAGAAQAGYYLFGNVSFGTGESPYAIVVDANGTPVWYRRSPSTAGVLNVESLSPGTISFAAVMPFTLGAGPVGQYEVVGLQPLQVAYTAPAGIPLDEHELRVLPNGDYLMLSDVIRAGFDLTGLQSFGPGSSIIDCTIQEVDPSGNSVWQWNATDHFDIVQDSTWPLTWMVDGENVVDPFHCNSIDVASNGDLLVSARHMDSIFYVDKVTGQVVWKMGGSQFTKDGASYVTVMGDPETTFYRQHDARFQAGGAISLFDDHTQEPGLARGVVYTVDADTDTATMAWQYAGAGSSAAMGSFRPTAGGGAIIGWGQPAVGNIIFSEVDRDGNDLLDMHFAAPDVSYRAIKVALGDLDIDVLRKTAGLP